MKMLQDPETSAPIRKLEDATVAIGLNARRDPLIMRHSRYLQPYDMFRAFFKKDVVITGAFGQHLPSLPYLGVAKDALLKLEVSSDVLKLEMHPLARDFIMANRSVHLAIQEFHRQCALVFPEAFYELPIASRSRRKVGCKDVCNMHYLF